MASATEAGVKGRWLLPLPCSSRAPSLMMRFAPQLAFSETTHSSSSLIVTDLLCQAPKPPCIAEATWLWLLCTISMLCVRLWQCSKLSNTK